MIWIFENKYNTATKETTTKKVLTTNNKIVVEICNEDLTDLSEENLEEIRTESGIDNIEMISQKKPNNSFYSRIQEVAWGGNWC